MKNSNKGFVVPLLIIIVILAAGGFYLYSKTKLSSQISAKQDCGTTNVFEQNKNILSQKTFDTYDKDVALSCLGRNILSNCVASTLASKGSSGTFENFLSGTGCIIRAQYFSSADQIIDIAQKKYAGTYLDCPLSYFSPDAYAIKHPGEFAGTTLTLGMLSGVQDTQKSKCTGTFIPIYKSSPR